MCRRNHLLVSGTCAAFKTKDSVLTPELNRGGPDHRRWTNVRSVRNVAVTGVERNLSLL